MASYLVQLADQGGRVLEGGMNAVVVEAEDAAAAREMAEFASGVDAADWANATVTELTAAADMQGWQVRVIVSDPAAAAGVAPVFDDTYVGMAADTLDSLGIGIAALLNVPFTASYTAGTQVLVIATGSGSDDLGDHQVRIGFFPPGASTEFGEAVQVGGVTGFVASVTDEGVNTADLDATFAADAYVVPSVPVLAKV